MSDVCFFHRIIRIADDEGHCWLCTQCGVRLKIASGVKVKVPRPCPECREQIGHAEGCIVLDESSASEDRAHTPRSIKLTEAPDKLLAKGEEWNPEYWTAQGYVRDWGDAAVSGNPYFEVLRKEDKQLKLTSFVILCPTFLRRPLQITATGDGYDLAWGSY